MNVLSACSGIGGLDLGLQRAGMTICGLIEADPWCQLVLNKHWPGVPLHDDVHTAPAWWNSTVRPEVDLVSAGIPCQPFSGAGQVRGVSDERWLWPAVAALVAATSPAWVLIENVPGIRRHGLPYILADLAVLGFDAWWSRVPAAAVGAPHLRWRFFLAAAHPERTSALLEPWRWEGPDGEDQAHPGWDGALWSMAPSGGRRPAVCGSDGQPGAGNRTWLPEPGVGRVADGVPARLDRLHGLGDAVVPQVGQYVGELIMQAEHRKSAADSW